MISRSPRGGLLLGMAYTALVLSLAAVAGAVELDDGLVYDIVTAVPCDRPAQSGDMVTVNYRGTLDDGTQFDSSFERNRPFQFDVGAGHVIAGWDEGVQGMCIGEDRNLTIPSHLGYGSSGMGPIPPGATLHFEITLLSIEGVGGPDDIITPEPAPQTSTQTTADDPVDDNQVPEDSTAHPSDDGNVDLFPDPASSLSLGDSVDGSSLEHEDTEIYNQEEYDYTDGPIWALQKGQCQLLGPFALFVQAGLGILALSSLVFKRWRERPRRPLKIWFFDASKQVFGSALLHLANLALAMLSSADLRVNALDIQDENGNTPNPCSFYLINIFVDTTIGILLLYLILKVLHRGVAWTPLANPPESIRSGHYGQPPRATWWLKQSLIYFIGLFLMKLCVFVLFKMLPWIAWVGAWALKWTEGNERIQIAFVMFVFPLVMNAIQYYIIDSFIKEKPTTDKLGQTEEEYEPIARASGSDEFDRDGLGDDALAGRLDRGEHASKDVGAPRAHEASAYKASSRPKDRED